MCCFFTVLVFLGPRIAGVIWWLVDRLRWSASFRDWPLDSLWWIWPVLGLIFLPWTTLMYVAVAPGGVEGFWEWGFLILAFIIDLGAYGGGGYGNRGLVGGS